MKRLEHIGIAVSDLEEAERIFGEILGSPAYKREEVAGESVLTSFFQTGESKVELLVPTSPDSAIAKHLEKRGPGLHHVAFHVEDLEAELARLESKGYRVVVGPKPGADGKRIAFLHPGTRQGPRRTLRGRLNLGRPAEDKMKRPNVSRALQTVLACHALVASTLECVPPTG